MLRLRNRSSWSRNNIIHADIQIGRDCRQPCTAAPKEQPPRKLSGKRTDLDFFTLKSCRDSSPGTPQEQVASTRKGVP